MHINQEREFAIYFMKIWFRGRSVQSLLGIASWTSKRSAEAQSLKTSLQQGEDQPPKLFA